jgi:hypothetical protein
MLVKVEERYRDWSPPVSVAHAVTQMIEGVPERFTAGMDSIILTNASGLNHSDRRSKVTAAGHKVRIAESGGLYHQAWKGKPAWIELFIDNIFAGIPQRALRFSFLRDMVLGSVLFHEIGHHVHRTCAPEFREKEDVAEDWSVRLLGPYMRRRYWYLLPFRPIVRLVRGMMPSRWSGPA